MFIFPDYVILVPNTAGVDAFAFDWSTDNNGLVPPMHLVGRVVKHMLHCKANGMLVVPKWTSALFWPSLVSDFGQFQFFVTEYIEYVKPKNFFVCGSRKDSIFAKSPFNSNVLVLRLICYVFNALVRMMFY